MPSSLRNRLNDLAASFSAAVLGAIRGSSLEELLSGPSRGKAAAVPSRPSPRASNVAAVKVPTAAPAPTPATVVRARKAGGRLPRRSAGDISKVLDQIVGLLKHSASGLRAEEIRQKLDLEPKELPRPLKEGVAAGRLSKVGQKRATTYSAAGTARDAGAKVAVRAAARRGRSSSPKAVASAKGSKPAPRAAKRVPAATKRAPAAAKPKRKASK
jgi:hypothetical protein